MTRKARLTAGEESSMTDLGVLILQILLVGVAAIGIYYLWPYLLALGAIWIAGLVFYAWQAP